MSGSSCRAGGAPRISAAWPDPWESWARLPGARPPRRPAGEAGTPPPPRGAGRGARCGSRRRPMTSTCGRRRRSGATSAPGTRPKTPTGFGPRSGRWGVERDARGAPGQVSGTRAVPRVWASRPRPPDVGVDPRRPAAAPPRRAEGLDDRRAARRRRGGFLGLGRPARAGGGQALPVLHRPAPALPARGTVNEFDVIRRLSGLLPPAPDEVVVPIGDDCAVVRIGGRTWAAASDMLIEGRHFKGWAAPEDVGYKAVAVNVSDVAAMGGTPRFVLVSGAAPD